MRSNVISVLHSFFDWANVEDLIEVDPSAKIRRPKKRRPDVYRPSLDELQRVRAAALPYERPAIVLMEGAGLRRFEVLGCRWADFDMVRGRLRVFRKGENWFYLPLAPDVVDELRASFRELQPELDDYVFTVEVEQWTSQYERVRRRKNPKGAASGQAISRMVHRVCKRAGVRELTPHQLRHGFANRFLRESGRDVAHCGLYSGTRASTQRRSTQTRSNSTTSRRRSRMLTTPVTHKRRLIWRRLLSKPSSTLETVLWRRRESNPRP
jgi:integrase